MTSKSDPEETSILLPSEHPHVCSHSRRLSVARFFWVRAFRRFRVGDEIVAIIVLQLERRFSAFVYPLLPLSH